MDVLFLLSALQSVHISLLMLFSLSHSFIVPLYPSSSCCQSLGGVPVSKGVQLPPHRWSRPSPHSPGQGTVSACGPPASHSLVRQEEGAILPRVCFSLSPKWACCLNCFVSGIFINSPNITPDRVPAACWQDPLASNHQMHDVAIKLDTCFSFPGIDFPPTSQHISWGKNNC